jgi:hypothetical protein
LYRIAFRRKPGGQISDFVPFQYSFIFCAIEVSSASNLLNVYFLHLQQRYWIFKLSLKFQLHNN